MTRVSHARVEIIALTYTFRKASTCSYTNGRELRTLKIHYLTHYKSKEYRFRLEAKPMLTLDQIIGRTPKELWELYDAEVTRQVKYFEGRMV